MAWAVISFFCGRYGREKGYSFWFSFLLCLLGQLIGLLAVLLLPDIARIRADAVGRDRAQDQEIATLKARLAVLESGSGTPAGTRVESPPAAPAVFPARTDEVIACPRCGRRQKGNPLTRLAAACSGSLRCIFATLRERRRDGSSFFLRCLRKNSTVLLF